MEEFGSTFQVTNYTHIPASQKSIQFTPGGTTTTFAQAERLVPPNAESDNESMEEELETLERTHHMEELADHEEEGEERIESGSADSNGSPCNSGDCESASDCGEEEDEEDIQAEGQDSNSRTGYDRDINRDPNIVPPPPEFEFFKHPELPHERILHLPETISINRGRPLDFFTLFFDEKELEILTQNTNPYALRKGASDSHKRRWYNTSAAELQVFLALVLYMGIWQSPQYTDYWAKTYKWPQHGIGKYMSKFRFEQIKRYFHVSAPYESLPRAEWYQKVEPLSDNLSFKFQRFMTPVSNIAVDEMMVRFTVKISEYLYK